MRSKATIHEQAREKVETAFAYAEDGAFHTAALIFGEVHKMYSARAARNDADMAKAMEEQNKRMREDGSTF